MAVSGITAKLEFDGAHLGAKDLSLKDSRTKTEVSSRGYQYIRALIGQRNLEISGSVEADSPIYAALKAKYDSGTSGLASYYGPCAGGPSAYGNGALRVTQNMVVTELGEEDPVGGEATVSFSLAISAEDSQAS